MEDLCFLISSDCWGRGLPSLHRTMVIPWEIDTASALVSKACGPQRQPIYRLVSQGFLSHSPWLQTVCQVHSKTKCHLRLCTVSQTSHYPVAYSNFVEGDPVPGDKSFCDISRLILSQLELPLWQWLDGTHFNQLLLQNSSFSCPAVPSAG